MNLASTLRSEPPFSMLVCAFALMTSTEPFCVLGASPSFLKYSRPFELTPVLVVLSLFHSALIFVCFWLDIYSLVFKVLWQQRKSFLENSLNTAEDSILFQGCLFVMQSGILPPRLLNAVQGSTAKNVLSKCLFHFQDGILPFTWS